MANSKAVYIEDKWGHPEVWLENDPGYEHYSGIRISHPCNKCGVEHVPMYGFDNSSGEYHAVYVCVDCMMDILGVTEDQ